jgi:diguanylate cyclase (GGDEF)-like protein
VLPTGSNTQPREWSPSITGRPAARVLSRPSGGVCSVCAAMSSVEATGIRVALLANYAGALRQLCDGDFEVDLPPARDAALHQLGLEIGTLAAVLEQKFAEFARLSQISSDMNAGLLLEEILERVYESFRGLIPYDRIGCALIDHAAWTLRARWARSAAREIGISSGYEQSLHGSSLETIVETGQPRIINDLPAYLASRPASDATRRIVAEGMRASLTCPLVARGRPIGFLFFSSQRTGAYADVHVDLFRRVAGELSIVVEKSLLYEKLFELNSQLTAAQQQLEHRANHDELTGLPNRRSILSELERVAARAARSRTQVGLLMLDIDHFKRINDRHGHLVGDQCLRQVGVALAAAVRTGEYLGRYGGEEFLAVLDLQDHDALQDAAARFRRVVEELAVPTADGPLPVTISVGGALGCPSEDLTVQRILANADAALYAAKAAGRNCTVIHERPPAQDR